MIRLDIDQRSLSALIANLYAFDEEVQREAKAAVQRAGEACYRRAYELAPKDTGYMASQLHLGFSEGGYVWAVGYREEDFRSRGLWPYFYAQEFGSATQPGTPHLGPAFREIAPEFQRDVSEMLRRAAERAGGR